MPNANVFVLDSSNLLNRKESVAKVCFEGTGKVLRSPSYLVGVSMEVDERGKLSPGRRNVQHRHMICSRPSPLRPAEHPDLSESRSSNLLRAHPYKSPLRCNNGSKESQVAASETDEGYFHHIYPSYHPFS